MKHSARETITHSEYLQLLGLAVIAREHYRAMENIERAMLSIVQEIEHDGSLTSTNGGGHVADAVWGSYGGIKDEADLREMLRKLGLIVEAEDAS